MSIVWAPDCATSRWLARPLARRRNTLAAKCARADSQRACQAARQPVRRASERTSANRHNNQLTRPCRRRWSRRRTQKGELERGQPAALEFRVAASQPSNDTRAGFRSQALLPLLPLLPDVSPDVRHPPSAANPLQLPRALRISQQPPPSASLARDGLILQLASWPELTGV